MKILFIFSLILSSVFSLEAQKPEASILLNCQEAHNVAKVIFFRPFRPLGSAIGFELYIKDSLQTKMRTNSFFVMELPEGKHRIASITGTLDILKKNKHTMELTVEAGKVYFVKCSAKSFSEGITKQKYRLLFKVLSKEEIKKALRKKFLRKHIQKKLYHDFYDLSS